MSKPCVHYVSPHVPDSFMSIFMYICCSMCVRSTKTDPGPERGGASVYIYIVQLSFIKHSSPETLKLDSYTISTVIIVLEK